MLISFILNVGVATAFLIIGTVFGAACGFIVGWGYGFIWGLWERKPERTK